MNIKRKLVIANYTIVLFAFCFFYFPWINWILFIVSQIILTIVNFVKSAKVTELCIYSLNLLISSFIANLINNLMFLTFVSNDSESVLVGNFALKVGLVFVFVISLIVVIAKIIKQKLF